METFILLVTAFSVNGEEIEIAGRAPVSFYTKYDCMEYAFGMYKTSEQAWDYKVEGDFTYILYPDNSVLVAECTIEGTST